MMACRFGLRRLSRAEGLNTGSVRVDFRRFFIGHQSMLESNVLVNRGRGITTKSHSQHLFLF
jgi:hypothetical protein